MTNNFMNNLSLSTSISHIKLDTCIYNASGVNCITEEQLRDALEEFKDELVHNIGINALIERYEY